MQRGVDTTPIGDDSILRVQDSAVRSPNLG